jgi:hypothetical protein
LVFSGLVTSLVELAATGKAVGNAVDVVLHAASRRMAMMGTQNFLE